MQEFIITNERHIPIRGTIGAGSGEVKMAVCWPKCILCTRFARKLWQNVTEGQKSFLSVYVASSMKQPQTD